MATPVDKKAKEKKTFMPYFKIYQCYYCLKDRVVIIIHKPGRIWHQKNTAKIRLNRKNLN